MTQEQIIRAGLLSTLDRETTDRLMTERPDAGKDFAIWIGIARMMAGMSSTELSRFVWVKMIEADMADTGSYQAAIPGFDLDIELSRIRGMVRELLDIKKAPSDAPAQ